jgi:serine/threonine protein kinase
MQEEAEKSQGIRAPRYVLGSRGIFRVVGGMRGARPYPANLSRVCLACIRESFKLADFQVLRRLGDGSYSEVLHVRHQLTGKEFALKLVDKQLAIRNKQTERLRLERIILDKCDYEGIVRLHFTFQDAANLYFGLELLPNGMH